jgi:hypothetical protein
MDDISRRTFRESGKRIGAAFISVHHTARTYSEPRERLTWKTVEPRTHGYPIVWFKSHRMRVTTIVRIEMVSRRELSRPVWLLSLYTILKVNEVFNKTSCRAFFVIFDNVMRYVLWSSVVINKRCHIFCYDSRSCRVHQGFHAVRSNSSTNTRYNTWCRRPS